jgi:glycosyltransferase involved in cell wall biosynthesis
VTGEPFLAPEWAPNCGALPLVTIVTPAYSAISWLPQCRASVAGQDYPKIEHIIVDGGSRDGTVELLQSWSGITWLSEPDHGQADAILKGFALGSGEILTWLNADDELTPGAVSRVVDTMTSRAASWVVGAAEIREGGKTRTVRPSRISTRRLDLSNPIVQPSSFYTAAAFQRAGGIDPHLHLAMDLDLWLRLLAVGVQPAVIRDVLSIAHLHDGAKTRAVPAERWFWEMGLARAKNGRGVAAGVELGRSYVEGLPDHPPPSPRDVTRHVRTLHAQLTRQGIRVSGRALEAGVRTRLAVRFRGRGRLRYLLAPAVMATQQTRSELWSAIRRRT